MRPNSNRMKELVENWVGDPIVYSVPQGYTSHINYMTHAESLSKGTCLPDDLILVHERRDHYSLQSAREMNVQGL